MKRFFSWVFLLTIVGSLLTCQRAAVEPDPFLDGTPRLKSISLSGISQAGISIDQAAKVISLRMPESIPNDIDITVELTDNAEWINKTTAARSNTLFNCDSCFHIYLKDKTDLSNQATVDYKVKLVPSAPLTIAPLSEPLPYIIRNSNFFYLDIPVLHLYGNKLPKQARLTYDKTGEELVISRDSSLHFSDLYRIQYGAYANRVAILLFDEKLVPGSYHIDLILDDGTILEVSQPVLVKPGTPDFTYDLASYSAYQKIQFGYQVALGRTFTIDGYNLFDGNVTLDLLDGQNKVYPLSGLMFDRYGRQIQVSIPTTLNPGQYVMRVWQNDIKFPYSGCLRVNILKDDQKRAVIGTIGDEFTPCSLHDPVSIPRGVRVSFSSSLKQQVLDGSPQNATLKLVSLSSHDAYYGTVVSYNANRGWDPNESLTLPATIPPGLYTAVLQVLDSQNNVVAESETYGRILDVK